ncbi:MAG: hypothetical protein AB7F66_16645 [Bacteriovoracia bacterium]
MGTNQPTGRGASPGFSMVSALAALGVSGILVAALTSSLDLFGRVSANAGAHVSFASLRTTLDMIFRDPQLCRAGLRTSDGGSRPHFQPDQPGDQEVASVYFGSTPIAYPGMPLGTARLIEVGFEPMPDVAPRREDGRITYSVRLRLRANKGMGAVGMREISAATSPIVLNIVTDESTHEIESCQSTETARGLCRSLGSQFDWRWDTQAGAYACQFAGAPSAGSALPGQYCYALYAQRWSATSCESGYYLKGLVKATDNDWDGYGGICCYAGTGADPRMTPDVQAAMYARRYYTSGDSYGIVSGTLGQSYRELVTLCRSLGPRNNPFGSKLVTCPVLDLLE